MPPLRLALLSHQDPSFGTATYARVRQLLPASVTSGRPRMAYLASDFRRLGPYFYAQREIYAGFGTQLDDLADVTGGFTPELLPKLRDYDGLHLSGGQTPRFLSLLRQHDLLPHLRAFAEAGGVLVGVSAGAILLTPTIDTAQSVGDDFAGAEADRTALGLVDFHFWPHFAAEDEGVAQAQAAALGRRIYTAADGGGVVVWGDEVEMVGGVRRFDGGAA